MVNKDFTNNTVSTNQACIPFKYEGAPLDKSNLRVLFLGNSITRHEIKESIGWLNEWGMAASSLDKDYVHQTIRILSKKIKPISYVTYNCAQYEKNYIQDDLMNQIVKNAKSYQPDIIIFRLGENFPTNYISDKKYNPYPYLLKLVSILKNICPKIVMTSLFWAHEIIDNALERVAKELNLEYVTINHLGSDDKYKAIGKFKHQGICLHPNDLGMQHIALLISDSIVKRYLR